MKIWSFVVLCRCDTGYESSSTCSSSRQDGTEPYSIIVPISSLDDLSGSAISSHGAVVGYQCGVLASGKAAVFNQNGRRLLETIDINMSSAK